MAWTLPPCDRPPAAFQRWLQDQFTVAQGGFAAQVLWQRGWRDTAILPGFLDWRQYRPTGPEAFGQELEWAIDRLTQAYVTGEKVAIWGDFDADGLTATALLWQGLGQWFGERLTYQIPDRLRESHGLSSTGLQDLADRGYRLILTCDTGSTDATLMQWGQSLGLAFIVTDHHTLPEQRPPVVAILNPRSFEPDHPLATLSGVAVAYKLMEALYAVATAPETPWAAPQFPLEELLDLVAIGLIADLVELRGDCRYLAQRGLAKLHELTQGADRRPGVSRLLEVCQASGDRPTDISFGLGPRINAVSRVQGDARVCVELLTSRAVDHCRSLAEQVEVLNLRRKALQRDLQSQIQVRLAAVDWSTTPAIVLGEVGWPVGILGLVAGQIAQTYHRPALLFSLDSSPDPVTGVALARGSARSVGNLTLYDLLQAQRSLIHQFGGHPQAAGLSLPVANLPLFKTAIEQTLRQLAVVSPSPMGADGELSSQKPSDATSAASTPVFPVPGPTADLIVQVKDLGQPLFQELRLLEPYGMGNPPPRLLIQNCWFKAVKHQNQRDHQGRKVRYIYTNFELWDESHPQGVPGTWWEHYGHELPQGRCDAMVELGVRPQSKGQKGQFQVTLLAVRGAGEWAETAVTQGWLLDWRRELPPAATAPQALVLRHCPTTWAELQQWAQRAVDQGRPLALAYGEPQPALGEAVWRSWVGWVKGAIATGQALPIGQLQQQLHLSATTLHQGQVTLAAFGFRTDPTASDHWHYQPETSQGEASLALLQQFLQRVAADRFLQRYFCQVPVGVLEGAIVLRR